MISKTTKGKRNITLNCYFILNDENINVFPSILKGRNLPKVLPGCSSSTIKPGKF